MSSLEFLNGQRIINPNRNRSGLIKELMDFKTLKVRPHTYQRLINLKEKLHYELNVTRGQVPSFDFVLNFLMSNVEIGGK